MYFCYSSFFLLLYFRFHFKCQPYFVVVGRIVLWGGPGLKIELQQATRRTNEQKQMKMKMKMEMKMKKKS